MRGTWQTTTGGGGGGGLVVAVVLVLLLFGSGAAAAITTALIAVLIALAVVAVLAITGAAAVLIYRARRGRPAVTYRAEAVPGPRIRHAMPDPGRPAIAAPAPRELHFHLHGVTEDQIAAAMRVIRLDATDVQ